MIGVLHWNHLRVGIFSPLPAILRYSSSWILGCSSEKDCSVGNIRLSPFIVGAEVGTKREMLRHSKVD